LVDLGSDNIRARNHGGRPGADRGRETGVEGVISNAIVRKLVWRKRKRGGEEAAARSNCLWRAATS